MGTRIEWCDETINPIIGCSKASPGCEHCYAERMARRLAGNLQNAFNRYRRVIWEGMWNGQTQLFTNVFDRVAKWRDSKRVFVCSMGDLFHDSVSDAWLRKIISRLGEFSRHTFILLTKRPQRALDFLQREKVVFQFPENVWFGVTVENQELADVRIPILLKIPASVLFVSVEPMLGPVDLSKYVFQGLYADPTEIGKFNSLSWVICGAETGPGKRHMNPGWARDLARQCHEANVPFFFKKFSDGTSLGMPRQCPK